MFAHNMVMWSKWPYSEGHKVYIDLQIEKHKKSSCLKPLGGLYLDLLKIELWGKMTPPGGHQEHGQFSKNI